jgi:ferric-dicitrate binding protein FerR (iron transport regulator)
MRVGATANEMTMADEREPLSQRQVGVALLADAHAPLATPRAWQRPVASIRPTDVGVRSGGSERGRVAAIALVVALAVAGILGLGSRADSQLTYELRGAGSEGGVIEAKRGEATVSLSDGSSILAENRTKFSVDVVGRNAALTRLVSGKLHVRVAHNDDTSYRFIAGPYEARVVGTEFELTWDPEASRLALSMSKGEVHLVEPGGHVRTLKAGQSLRLPAYD